MQVPNNERVIKIPRGLMQFLKTKALAFCIPKKSAIVATIIAIPLLAGVLCLAVLNFILIPLAVFSLPFFLMLALYFSSTIVIRRDCYECRFMFHIMAHERNHLALNSLDEAFVEEETLKQTSDQLIPILLSNPKMCKDCSFRLRRMYSQATFDYLKEKQE